MKFQEARQDHGLMVDGAMADLKAARAATSDGRVVAIDEAGVSEKMVMMAVRNGTKEFDDIIEEEELKLIRALFFILGLFLGFFLELY